MMSVLVLFGVVEYRVVLSKMKKDFSLRPASRFAARQSILIAVPSISM
jgi:hypothetical protein